ncbi:DUF3298 domain-containing protein [Leptotrichia sp. OH3620_COT-345]|uniref:DUF3298 domain-containing protein n=1 Tax=Leptotrichia sp. OH3620_COT-345 TaxID=2491048 RepID=UPI000F647D85|nr:DUF3298 domain-containing protein [Leptotrichia sp. OH3620_COT-345]RRD38458.1 DUF3298 domain-containing protein [Leptotrichia sp. OH3620_COT-345]
MKKFGIILMALILATLSFGARKEKVDTTFTFQNYLPTAPDVVKEIARSKNLDGSVIAYPVFTGNTKIVANMNKAVNKLVNSFKGNKDKTYKVEYKVVGSNDRFVSVLFTVEKNDKKYNSVTKLNEALTFNVKNGKEMGLKDIFVQGYENALNSAINDKIRQFGLTVNESGKEKFKGVHKGQKFYMEDDSIVLFYNPGEGLDFADGQLFIPFITRDLIGIIK